MRLAIGNPLTAPYGVAAMQFLMRADVWDEAQNNLVYGENIAQTLQFVASGNASLGVIAASQVLHESLPAASCDWVVPATMHEPIEQQAIQLSNNEAARAFLEFVRGPEGRRIIRGLGYEVPD
jgi:molybdate transport system substrate-binding protein